MKLQLNKKKLKNLSKDAQILPKDVTPQVGGAGVYTNTCVATIGDCLPVITQDVFCGATGSCGCISLRENGCNTNTCY